MIAQDQMVVTRADGQRLHRMIGSARESLRTIGDPYDVYLRALENNLAQASMIPETEVDENVVTMNSKVCLRDMDTGKCRMLTLVYDADGDSIGKKISVLTPLGASILGARVGSIVERPSRRGPRRSRIEHILFQPEAAGAFDL